MQQQRQRSQQPSSSSPPPPFHVVVRCRSLIDRESSQGARRFPFRKDLSYQCAVVPDAFHQPNGYVSIFDPDSTSVLTHPQTSQPPQSHLVRHSTNSRTTTTMLLAPLQEGERRYHFHDVFGDASSNEDIYRVAVKPLVEAAWEGYHATCFAYGMTGSGKSYTMIGEPPLRIGEERSVLGMCHYAMHELFERVDELQRDQEMSGGSGSGGQRAGARGYATTRPQHQEVIITATFVELYNERIRDLLLPSSSLPHTHEQRAPDIVEDVHGGTSLRNVTSLQVTSLAALEVLLEEGNMRRTKASTVTNECSSRSHAVLQLLVQRPADVAHELHDGGGGGGNHHKMLRSRLSLVDLAGSERAVATSDLTNATDGERADRRREGSNINKSLLALGNCITALGAAATKQSLQQNTNISRSTSTSTATTTSTSTSTAAVFVPYRDSKLTRLLRDALGGNTRTVMIATISPSCLCYEETLATLKYATRAMAISRSVQRNVVVVTTPTAVSGVATDAAHVHEYEAAVSGTRPMPRVPPAIPMSHQSRHHTSMQEGRDVSPPPRGPTFTQDNPHHYSIPPPLPHDAAHTTSSNHLYHHNRSPSPNQAPTTDHGSPTWLGVIREEERGSLRHWEAKVVAARTQLRVAEMTAHKVLNQPPHPHPIHDSPTSTTHNYRESSNPLTSIPHELSMQGLSMPNTQATNVSQRWSQEPQQLQDVPVCVRAPVTTVTTIDPYRNPTIPPRTSPPVAASTGPTKVSSDDVPTSTTDQTSIKTSSRVVSVEIDSTTKAAGKTEKLQRFYELQHQLIELVKAKQEERQEKRQYGQSNSRTTPLVPPSTKTACSKPAPKEPVHLAAAATTALAPQQPHLNPNHTAIHQRTYSVVPVAVTHAVDVTVPLASRSPNRTYVVKQRSPLSKVIARHWEAERSSQSHQIVDDFLRRSIF